MKVSGGKRPRVSIAPPHLESGIDLTGSSRRKQEAFPRVDGRGGSSLVTSLT